MSEYSPEFTRFIKRCCQSLKRSCNIFFPASFFVFRDLNYFAIRCILKQNCSSLVDRHFEFISNIQQGKERMKADLVIGIPLFDFTKFV